MYTTVGLTDLHRRTQHCFKVLLDHLDRFPADKLTEPLEGFGFPTLKEQFLHIIGAEHFWLGMLKGKPGQRWKDDEVQTVSALRDLLGRVAGETMDYLAELDDEALNQRIELVFPDGSFHSTPGLVMVHVVTHGFHHKGQIAAMCRILGHPTDDTDLVIGVG